ncbi:MAG: c-type cytochrome [Sulfurovum sp.]|nr:c-type cytochrome [Sulfurovum sp.]
MKKTSFIVLSTVAIFGLSGCGNAPESSPEEKTYSKTPAEVYAESCVKCHGQNAEGNPEKKGPALNDRQAGELELDLYDVKNAGTNQSSGTEHDIMAHNMKKLSEQGFDYDPKAMAEYIEKSFYKMEVEAAPVPESKEAVAEDATEAEGEEGAEETPAEESEAVAEEVSETNTTEETPAE